MICEDNLQCLFDLAVTDEMEFAMNTLEQEKIANTTTEVLSKPVANTHTFTMSFVHLSLKYLHTDNFPPKISTDVNTFKVTTGTESVYSLIVSDPGDNFTLSVQGPVQDYSLNFVGDGTYVFHWNLSEPTFEPLVFIATDSGGASSSLIPTVEVCACANGGNCTLDGLLTGNSTVILKCQCPQGKCLDV